MQRVESLASRAYARDPRVIAMKGANKQARHDGKEAVHPWYVRHSWRSRGGGARKALAAESADEARVRALESAAAQLGRGRDWKNAMQRAISEAIAFVPKIARTGVGSSLAHCAS